MPASFTTPCVKGFCRLFPQPIPISHYYGDIPLEEGTKALSTESAKTERFVRDLTENARRLYAYIYSLLPNWSDADEVFQETSAVLWTKYDEYQPGTGFREWAFRVAYFKVLQFRKAQGKNVLRFSDQFIDAVDRDTQVGSELWNRRHRLLADCYEELRPQDRQLLDLRYEPGATTKDVAARVGRSPDAVYKAMNRIHEQLLDCIEAKQEQLP